MVGFVSFADLRSLYRRMDVYVSPSLEVDGDVEGFGISFIEAGAVGKPVIAGRSGGVGDAVIDGETGILVDPGDSAALRNAICLLLDNDELRHRLGQAARNRIARECTHASQTNALSALSVRGVFEV